MSTPKVLIIGAGLGGLTLAQNLRQKGIAFEIFERDESKDSRKSGWALTLHKGVVSQLTAIVPPEASSLNSVAVLHETEDPIDEFRIYDAHSGRRIGRWDAAKDPWIRVNRGRFRNWLLTGINVHWNMKFQSYKVNDDNTITAIFEDGTTATGDILVGADGTSSRVRDQLFYPRKMLKGIPIFAIMGGLTLDASELKFQRSLGKTMYLAISEDSNALLFVGTNTIAADLSSSGHYWAYYEADERASNMDEFWAGNATKEERLEYVQAKLASWHPDFQKIVQLQPAEGIEKFVPRDAMPEPIPERLVTLIGDAAHTMSPARAEGAVNAIKDACELTEQLEKAFAQKGRAATVDKASLYEDALRQYEIRMIPRARDAVLRSRAGIMGSREFPAQWREE